MSINLRVMNGELEELGLYAEFNYDIECLEIKNRDTVIGEETIPADYINMRVMLPPDEEVRYAFINSLEYTLEFIQKLMLILTYYESDIIKEFEDHGIV